MHLSVEQLTNLLGESRVDPRKENLRSRCPKCGSNEFGISLSNNHPFGCYRKNKCGFSGNIYTLLSYLGRLQEFLEGGGYDRKGQLENKLIQAEESIDLSLEQIKRPLGWKRIKDHPYLRQRGFTDEDFETYEIGTTTLDPDVRNNYVIFLFRRNSIIIGWLARHIWSKSKILEYEQKTGKRILRYRNSTNSFGKILLGYDNLSNSIHTVILVEGLFDKVNIDRLLELQSSNTIKCCCTFKADISREQIELIRHYSSVKNILLFYDPDVVNQIKKVGIILEKYFENIYILFSEWEGIDPGDMTLEQVNECIENMTTLSNFLVKKLQTKKLK